MAKTCERCNGAKLKAIQRTVDKNGVEVKRRLCDACALKVNAVYPVKPLPKGE